MVFDLSTITLIIFGVVPLIFTTLLVVKLIKTGFKITVFLFLLVTLVIAGLGILSYLDMQDLQEHQDEPELWLMVEDEAILTGFERTRNVEEQPTALTQDQLDQYTTYYRNDNREALREGHFKVYFVKPEVFEDVPSGVDLVQQEDIFPLTKERAMSLIRSDRPIELYTQYFMEHQDIPQDRKEELEAQVREQVGEPTELKARMASLLFSKLIEEHGTEVILEKIREDEIEVYPQGLTERLITLLPTSVTSKFMEE